MPHLKVLDLRDNKIISIPDEIAMLQHVIRLDLTNNDITTLPNTLGLLPHLQNLQIEGNSLKQIRMDVIKGGTNRILKHLREKLQDNQMEKVQKSQEKCHITEPFPNKYQMRGSRALNLTMKELTKIPDDVFHEAEKAEVTAVDLCKNKLIEVPPG